MRRPSRSSSLATGFFELEIEKKAAGVGKAQDLDVPEIGLDVAGEGLAERAVEHVIDRGDVREGEGDVDHADLRIVGREAADRGKGGLDDAVPHLLGDLEVLAELAVREDLDLDLTIGRTLDDVLEHLAERARRVLEGIVIVQMPKLQHLLRRCDRRADSQSQSQHRRCQEDVTQAFHGVLPW